MNALLWDSPISIKTCWYKFMTLSYIICIEKINETDTIVGKQANGDYLSSWHDMTSPIVVTTLKLAAVWRCFVVEDGKGWKILKMWCMLYAWNHSFWNRLPNWWNPRLQYFSVLIKKLAINSCNWNQFLFSLSSTLFSKTEWLRVWSRFRVALDASATLREYKDTNLLNFYWESEQKIEAKVLRDSAVGYMIYWLVWRIQNLSYRKYVVLCSYTFCEEITDP